MRVVVTSTTVLIAPCLYQIVRQIPYGCVMNDWRLSSSTSANRMAVCTCPVVTSVLGFSCSRTLRTAQLGYSVLCERVQGVDGYNCMFVIGLRNHSLRCVRS